MLEAAAKTHPAAGAAHSDPMTPKPMTQAPMKPYNTRTRIVLDICIQIVFYLVLAAGFWLITFLIP